MGSYIGTLLPNVDCVPNKVRRHPVERALLSTVREWGVSKNSEDALRRFIRERSDQVSLAPLWRLLRPNVAYLHNRCCAAESFLRATRWLMGMRFLALRPV